MSIDFACPSCQKKYRVKDELAGKSAKCSKCNSKFKVPTPVADLPDLDALDSGNDLGDWFDDELSATKSVAATASKSQSSAPATKSSGGSSCSACGNRLATGAVICVACGFDTRSGKKHVTKKVIEDDQPDSKAKQVAKQSASLARGAMFSAIGAVLGAAIWAAVAIFLNVQIGWIAWGLGFAAGAGMAIGHEDNDGTTAGIIAAGISILGIFAAKFFIFEHLKSQMSDLGLSIEALSAIAGEEITFMMLFGPIDGLFILLAVASAYKIGSGQMTD